MEMKLDINKLKNLRETKAWSQAHLADVAGLSLRTIQRIEKLGVASPDSVKAICSSYDIEASELIKSESGHNDAQPGSRGSFWSSIGRAEILATMAAFTLAFIMAFYFSS